MLKSIRHFPGVVLLAQHREPPFLPRYTHHTSNCMCTGCLTGRSRGYCFSVAVSLRSTAKIVRSNEYHRLDAGKEWWDI